MNKIKSKPKLLLLISITVLFILSGCSSEISGKAIQSNPVDFASNGEMALLEQTFNEMPYVLSLPKDYNSEAQQQWPLIVYLHAYGMTMQDAKEAAPYNHLDEMDEFSFITLTPYIQKLRWIDHDDTLLELIDSISKDYLVDPSRIYLTGISLGGYGTFELGAEYKDKFAALAPIAGGGNPTDGEKYLGVPIWVFHNDEDYSVSVNRSIDMVEAIQEAGHETVKFTIYERAGHDAWTETYGNPELYRWFLEHSLGE